MRLNTKAPRLKRGAALCAALAIIVFPALSTAGEPSEEPVAVRVSFKDLDLARPSDAAAFLSRLHDAALEACGGSVFSALGYISAIERSECFKVGLARAVEATNAPKVARLYLDASRRGR
jgi:UrcA family protein